MLATSASRSAGVMDSGRVFEITVSSVQERVAATIAAASPHAFMQKSRAAWRDSQRIAVATASIPPSRARTPHNPGTRRRETRRDFGPRSRPCRAIGQEPVMDTPRGRDPARSQSRCRSLRNVGQNAKTPPRSLGGVP
jgi:hypothetical protein